MKSKHRTLDVELFERWGSTYERSWMQQRLFDPVHSAVLHQAASRFKPESVLDIGCGSGRLLRKVHDYWPEAHLSGVDPAQKMLEVARQLAPEARFSMGSGEALPLEDASVDLALSTISFHHWLDQAAGVREVARVLRVGGSFLLADFTLPTWLAWLLPRVHSAAQRSEPGGSLLGVSASGYAAFFTSFWGLTCTSIADGGKARRIYERAAKLNEYL